MPKVWVVDDDAATCRAVTMLLRSAGHSAQCLPSGDDALRALLADPLKDELPRLIVLDVMMRGADGLEVLRQVRLQPGLSQVAIVMYTAVLDAVSRERAIQLGAQGYIIKSGGWSALYPELVPYLHQFGDQKLAVAGMASLVARVWAIGVVDCERALAD